MILFKCSCGCFFTIKQIGHYYPKCPNCGQLIKIDSEGYIEDISHRLDEAKATMQVIPDDANIKISFDL